MVHKYNQHVEEARVNLDYAELSRLGKKGAEAREKKREIKRIEKDFLLAGAEEKLRQAHEDICPID